MNELIVRETMWMESREIAEATGKRHDNVIRDIEIQLDNHLKFEAVYSAGNGESRKCYRLPYREIMILISGYSAELRAKIIDRWMELESKNKPSIPQTYSEALRLAADQAEQIELMKPKVESFEALQRSDKNMSITDCSKHFNLHPKKEVFPYLRANAYLTSKDLPTQTAIDRGILTERQTKGSDGVYRGQAVVECSMLETWRVVVVPSIKRWLNVNKLAS